MCVCWSIYFCFLLSGSWLFFAYVVLFMVISGGDQLCRQRRFLWWTGSSLLRTLTPCEFLVLSVFLFILFFFNFDDKVTSLGLRSQKSWESLLLLKSTCGEKEGFFFFLSIIFSLILLGEVCVYWLTNLLWQVLFRLIGDLGCSWQDW